MTIVHARRRARRRLAASCTARCRTRRASGLPRSPAGIRRRRCRLTHRQPGRITNASAADTPLACIERPLAVASLRARPPLNALSRPGPDERNPPGFPRPVDDRGDEYLVGLRAELPRSRALAPSSPPIAASEPGDGRGASPSNHGHDEQIGVDGAERRADVHAMVRIVRRGGIWSLSLNLAGAPDAARYNVCNVSARESDEQHGRRSSAQPASCCLALAAGAGAVRAGQDPETRTQATGQAKRPKIRCARPPSVGVAPPGGRSRPNSRAARTTSRSSTARRSSGIGATARSSESTSDCEPYEAGKSQIKRRFTVEHMFRARRLPGLLPPEAERQQMLGSAIGQSSESGLESAIS